MNIQEKIKDWIKETLEIEEDFVLAHPKDLKNGDYSFFVPPKPVAKEDTLEDIVKILSGNKIPEIERIEAVGNFINFYLSKDFFVESVKEIIEGDSDYGKNNSLKNQKIIIEHTVTNVLKPMHIGHLMGNVVGESLSRILEWNKAELKRNNYQGDIGLHIAKALWGIIKLGGMIDGDINEKIKYIGEAYALGSNAYEDDEKVQEEIKEINKKIFEKSDDNLNKIYKWGREISLAHFEDLYKKLGTKFDYYFFESEVVDNALKIVKEFLQKGLFEESERAIVFRGEKFDPKLHTRVFVNKEGLPTYEAKDIAHAIRKYEAYKSDKSIIITANEQDGYFEVMLRALKEIRPEIAIQTTHLSHGMLKLTTGKMSSRKGNIITGESLIEDVENLVKEKIKDRDFSESEKQEVAEIVAIGAIKYSILRQAIGGDIIFDFDKSISFEGDSGPYLQYACVRANSVLEKAISQGVTLGNAPKVTPWETTELEKYLYRFPEVVERAGKEYAPHYIVTYLTELASAFNSSYAKEKIIDKEDLSSPYKIALTQATAHILKSGLNLLGIKVPERM
ncbi:MAG: arginine--tRNA ligase [Patescibacteria group bacterium]